MNALAEMPGRLYRRRTGKMISGVACGLADYFDVDPTLVRLVFIIAALINGFGIFVYIIMSFIVPVAEAEPVRESFAGKEPTDVTNTNPPREEANVPHAETSTPATPVPALTGAQGDWHPGDPQRGEWRHREQRHTWAGLILIALGVLFLAQNLGLLWWWNWRIFWPAVLIGVGALLLTRQLRR
jgi:phage shock protein PspC (stress-responsive transcriptional regulator)